MATDMRITVVVSLILVLVSPPPSILAFSEKLLPVPVTCLDRCPVSDADCIDACQTETETDAEEFPAKRASAFVRIGRPSPVERRASSFIRIGKNGANLPDGLDSETPKRKDSFVRIGRKSAFVRIGRGDKRSKVKC